MSLFLLFYVFVYTGMHALVLSRVRHLIPGGRAGLAAAAVFCLFMVAAPVLNRILEHYLPHSVIHVTSWLTYLWMGMVTVGVAAALAAYAADAVFVLVRLARGTGPWSTGTAGAVFVVACAVAAAAWGTWEAGRIRVEHVVVETDRIPAGAAPLRIAQITDLHLGILAGAGRVEKVAALVRSVSPDLVVCTGDLIDGPVADEEAVFRAFAEITAPLGKLAVTGNHEMYHGYEESVKFTEQCGFRVLDTEAALVDGRLTVVGVAEPFFHSGRSEAPVLESAPGQGFVMLLKHQPVVDEKSTGLFGLQLSGHTHGGQIFPFHYAVGAMYPYYNGRTSLGRGSEIYASRGTGTWGPQMRVGAPPELTVVELRGTGG